MDFSINAQPENKKEPALKINDKPVSALKPKKQDLVFGPVMEPSQEAVEGIKFDYCDGLRVKFPGADKTEKRYRVAFFDMTTDDCVYTADVEPGATVASCKKYFIPFRFEIYYKDGKDPIFKHSFNAEDKPVLIQLPVGTLGDSIAWFSYIERFQKQQKCKIFVSMAPWIADILKKQYPDFQFIQKDDTDKQPFYACYYLGLYFKGNTTHQPYDFRYVGLHKTAGHILGVEDLSDIPPRVDLSAKRTIRGRYVVIAAKASSQSKYWNNPAGWRQVIKFLKDNGYRVICIDKEQEHGCATTWNYIPFGCEDFTGDRPLQERINIIKDADFFIGLSSGLSWLAWTCKIPVVMISGFTEPQNEFFTPYRIINTQVCHGCWNDTRCDFDHFDFWWCPRFKDKPEKKFECTRAISANAVIRTIEKIPAFQKQKQKFQNRKTHRARGV